MRERDAKVESVLPEYKGMEPERAAAIGPHEPQGEWATKEDHYRFGWNAARAEVLRKFKAMTNQPPGAARE